MCDSDSVTRDAPGGGDRSGYGLDEAWPHYPADMEFEMGSGVAIDAQGILLTVVLNVNSCLGRFHGKAHVSLHIDRAY